MGDALSCSVDFIHAATALEQGEQLSDYGEGRGHKAKEMSISRDMNEIRHQAVLQLQSMITPWRELASKPIKRKATNGREFYTVRLKSDASELIQGIRTNADSERMLLKLTEHAIDFDQLLSGSGDTPELAVEALGRKLLEFESKVCAALNLSIHGIQHEAMLRDLAGKLESLLPRMTDLLAYRPKLAYELREKLREAQSGEGCLPTLEDALFFGLNLPFEEGGMDADLPTKITYHGLYRWHVLVKCHPELAKPLGQIPLDTLAKDRHIIRTWITLLSQSRQAEKLEWVADSSDPLKRPSGKVSLVPKAGLSRKSLSNLVGACSAAVAVAIRARPDIYGTQNPFADKSYWRAAFAKAADSSDALPTFVMQDAHYLAFMKLAELRGEWRLRAAMAMCYLAMRPNMIIAARIEDYDPRTCTLYARRAVNVLGEEKGTKNGRIAALPLRGMEKVAIEAAIEKSRALGSEYILASPEKPHGRGSMNLIKLPWQELRAALEWPEANFYDLKHAHVTTLALRGGKLEEIRYITGHANTAALAKHYSQVQALKLLGLKEFLEGKSA